MLIIKKIFKLLLDNPLRLLSFFLIKILPNNIIKKKIFISEFIKKKIIFNFF